MSTTQIEYLSYIKYLLPLIKSEREYQTIVMDTASEILSRLKLLGHIQKGDKVNSRNMILQPDGWVTRLYRGWITPDNRSNTLKLIREIVARSFEILGQNVSSKKESDIIQCKLIIVDLQRSQVGLLNLKGTYRDDVKFGCDLDILLQHIASKVIEMKKLHPFLNDADGVIPENTDNSLP